MLHYDIVFPPPAQLGIRREKLDYAGFHAWLSPILLLSSIYIGRLLLARTPSDEKIDASKQPSPIRKLYSRIKRWLSTTYFVEFGPLQVQVAGCFYLSWLLFLIFRNTGNDYLHLTKAFGHVAVSQLPLHYLLALQNPRSPIVLATGLTYRQLNAYHRLSGRMMHSLLATHAILYINFFVVKDLLAKRIQHWDVRLGIAAFWLVNLLALLALPVARKKARRLFYRSHVVFSAALPVVLFFHVPYTRSVTTNETSNLELYKRRADLVSFYIFTVPIIESILARKVSLSIFQSTNPTIPDIHTPVSKISSQSTSKTSILPPYTPMIPSVAPEPTLSNMLGSVMSAVGLGGRNNKARNGSEQEAEGPRGDVNTSAKPHGAVPCMTDPTSIFPSPLTDYQGPPTVRPTSIRPKLTVPPGDSQKPPRTRPINVRPKSPTVPPTNNQGPPTDRPTSYRPKSPTLGPTTGIHVSSDAVEAPEASSTPPIGPDATTVKSLSGVITLAPDATQTMDESPKPPITDSPPLPPNTVTAMFADPTTLETTQDMTSVVTRWSCTPSGHTRPPRSTYTRWEDMTPATLNTTARTDPVDSDSVRIRRGDVVHIAGESEIKTCDTGPSVTSTMDSLPPTGYSDADDELSDDDYPPAREYDPPARQYFTNTRPEEIFTLLTSTETVIGPAAGAASPDSMWSVVAETGTVTEAMVSSTQRAASPDSMWSVPVETGTVTETEIGMGGGMSTVAASTAFATPAARVNDVGVADNHMQAIGFMAGNVVALMAGLLMLGALKSGKKI